MKRILIVLASAALIYSCQNHAHEKKADVANSATTTSAANDNVLADSANFTSILWLDSARDMGKVKEGDKVEIAFRFRNTGNKPLIIKSVTPGCGCTVADYPKEPVMPGKEGEIKGVFDSNGRPGVAHKSMTVAANTTGMQYHNLTFQVDVQPKKAE